MHCTSAHVTHMAPTKACDTKNVPDGQDSFENEDGTPLSFFPEEDFVIVDSVDEESSDENEEEEENEDNQADPSGAYRLLQQDDMNQPNGHLFDEQDSADDDSADSGLEANEVETHEAGACAIGYTVEEPTLAINYSDLNISGVDDVDVPCSSRSLFSNNTEECHDTTSHQPNNIQMDEGKAEQVKNAMRGFVLPPMNVPEWAKNIPEDQWIASLFEKSKEK